MDALVIVLGIETSGPFGSVALLNESRLLGQLSLNPGVHRGRDLLPCIDSLCKSHALGPEALDLIAVSQGPGSYTGVRVGLSCAKTLAWSLTKPLSGVCSLDVIAQNAPPDADSVCVIVDAKRQQLYIGLYERKAGRLDPGGEPRLLPPADAAAIANSRMFVIGDGIEHYGEPFAAKGCRLAGPDIWTPQASIVARMGREKYLRGETIEPHQAVPIYLGRSEAEEKWERRTSPSR